MLSSLQARVVEQQARPFPFDPDFWALGRESRAGLRCCSSRQRRTVEEGNLTEVDVLGRRYKVEDDGTVCRVMPGGKLVPRARVPHPNQIISLVHRPCCGKVAYVSREDAREAA